MIEVSVVMAVYKESPQVVERSVNSIINQTLNNIEFIIILDWPENTALRRYLEECAYKDNRIIVLINDRNRGQGYSRNRGIEIAKGKYIALQDGDDACLHERLEKQYNFLQSNPNIDVLGAGYTYYDFNIKKVLFKRMYSPDVSKVIKRISPCGHPSIMVRKNIYFEKGGYDTEFRSVNGGQVFVEDYDLFIRWFIQGVKITNLQELLYIYHREDKYIMPKVKGMVKSVVDIKLKYMKHLNFGIGDYIYFGLQVLTLLFPASFVNKLFKWMNYN